MMDQIEQEQFINDLVDNVRKDLIVKVHRGVIPLKWDGVELRQLLADKFKEAANGWGSHGADFQSKRSKRRRDYENIVLVKNL